MILVLAVVLPSLYWEGGPETAPALREARITSIEVPAEHIPSWRGVSGMDVKAPTGQPGVKLATPAVNYRMDEASASTAPWVDSNGWRILRQPGARFVYDAPGKAAALAAAEAFAYGARGEIHTNADGLAPLGEMLAFLGSVPDENLPAAANIGYLDDGSAKSGEVMNLLVRRNLLFRLVQAPDPQLDLNVKIGSPEFPESEADNPDMMAHKIRQELSDAKRLVRIYGSEVVIARLESDGKRARLHLLNYAGAKRPVAGLRVRVLGRYRKAALLDSGLPGSKVLDYTLDRNATEFTLAELKMYAVIDLSR